MSFVNLFSQFYHDTFYTRNYRFEHLYTTSFFKPICQAKNRRTEAVFHLDNRLKVPLNNIAHVVYE